MVIRSYVRYKASYPPLPAERRVRIDVTQVGAGPASLLMSRPAPIQRTRFPEKGKSMTTVIASRSALTAPHLRLTARGRAVFTILMVAVVSSVVAVGILGGASATASNALGAVTGGSSLASTGPQSFEYLQIEPGQSLWEVAQSIAPSADPRDVIYDIVTLNQLPSAEVQPGLQLAIPLKYTR